MFGIFSTRKQNEKITNQACIDLIDCIKENDLEKAKSLLSSNTDIINSYSTYDRYTPLMEALNHTPPNKDFIQYLLSVPSLDLNR
jgi:hypothetical protein